MTSRTTLRVTKCVTPSSGSPPLEWCAENRILFVDVCPVLMRQNADAICYLPFPFLGEFHYLNESGDISNVATNIIPFIFPLHRFASVEDYMVHTIKPGQILNLVRGILPLRNVFSVGAAIVSIISICICYYDDLSRCRRSVDTIASYCNLSFPKGSDSLMFCCFKYVLVIDPALLMTVSCICCCSMWSVPFKKSLGL